MNSYRQLLYIYLQEGWAHHIARNAAACFLTRGDLWISWEEGLQHFLHYLLDADWSVCAGNWMWVSSSAFEQLLDCSLCICPVSFGKRFDPNGLYAKYAILIILTSLDRLKLILPPYFYTNLLFNALIIIIQLYLTLMLNFLLIPSRKNTN